MSFNTYVSISFDIFRVGLGLFIIVTYHSYMLQENAAAVNSRSQRRLCVSALQCGNKKAGKKVIIFDSCQDNFSFIMDSNNE